MTRTTLHFDDSLRAFTRAVAGAFGRDVASRGMFLRDAAGYLAFILPADAPQAAEDLAWPEGDPLLRVTIAGRVFLRADDPGVSYLLASGPSVGEHVYLDDGALTTIRLLDRRIVGQDWLLLPAPGRVTRPGRLVFSSMKGGVGRSTALAVLAADLAARGQRVLTIDLDLEAPGLGALLLGETRSPKYGALDWYVETGLGEVDADFVEELVMPSPLSAGSGLIDVVPAIGRTGDEHPANVLAKLARAYVEVPADEGLPRTFSTRTAELVDRLTVRARYDAVLIDARAGLNESTAAAVLGLGADVLLFGMDSPQTFVAYRYLFAHLARFPRPQLDDLVLRLKLVHAKAPVDSEARRAFRERAFDRLFTDFLYPEVASDQMDEFSIEDEAAPHFAWPILADDTFGSFDPLGDPAQLTEPVYQRTFERFLEPARARLALTGDLP